MNTIFSNRNLLQDTVQVVNYSKKFSLLLYLEELQARKDIRMYDMKKVTLKRSSGGARLWLEVMVVFHLAALHPTRI